MREAKGSQGGRKNNDRGQVGSAAAHEAIGGDSAKVATGSNHIEKRGRADPMKPSRQKTTPTTGNVGVLRTRKETNW